MYFGRPTDLYVSDGSGDGKADAFLTIQKPKSTRYAVLNAKFTKEFDRSSPVAFYDEITRFWQAFENKSNRPEYLKNAVRESLRPKYKQYFARYDEGLVDLYFITNHKTNPRQLETVKSYGVEVLHLEDLLQYLIEHLEGALPETDPLALSDITSVLTPPVSESEVPTSIVFARLIDFIRYMEDDPFDFLFARNVRLWLGFQSQTNKDIAYTFENAPKEFAYSNNGITVLCKSHRFDPGKRELVITNPRVVNGSQTLHSIRDSQNPSSAARVMVRIIEVPSDGGHDLPKLRARRREIIHRISVRSNMQNPIKRWNLVANDDFQNELSQFFWQKKLFYERRQHEWKQRKDDLKSIGISQGPEIRWLTQLIASFYCDRSNLGPALAQGQLNTLFDEAPYATIRSTPPELAHRIYVLGELVYLALGTLSKRRAYIAEVAGYIKFSLFALACKTLSRVDSSAWRKDSFETFLESQWENPSGLWVPLTKALVDHILQFYAKEAKKAEREGWYLSQANFFKSRAYVSPMIRAPLPQKIVSIGRKLYSAK